MADSTLALRSSGDAVSIHAEDAFAFRVHIDLHLDASSARVMMSYHNINVCKGTADDFFFIVHTSVCLKRDA